MKRGVGDEPSSRDNRKCAWSTKKKSEERGKFIPKGKQHLGRTLAVKKKKGKKRLDANNTHILTSARSKSTTSQRTKKHAE